MKKFNLLAATALTMAIAAPAYAQDAPVPVETQDSEFTGANDIVVTATRRDETVQDVPIAITAVGNELLENAGVTDIRGLEQLAPSLQSSTGQSSATGTTLYIRGITTAGDNPGFEPAVGVFIDGVYRARAGVAVSELPELERVEILRHFVDRLVEHAQGALRGRFLVDRESRSICCVFASAVHPAPGFHQEAVHAFNRARIPGLHFIEGPEEHFKEA